MKFLLKVLTFSFLLLSFPAAEGARSPPQMVPKQSGWVQLAPEQQKILAPVADDWDQLPDSRRQRILATVKHYPKMKPAEQQRYSERLVDWAKMSAEQRRVARERYKKFQSLPPGQQEQIKRRWAEQHPVTNAQPDATHSVAAPTPGAGSSVTVNH